MTLTEIAATAAPFQRFVQDSWDHRDGYKFYYFFNANGAMRASDENAIALLLFRHDLAATDWRTIEEDEVAEELRGPR